MSTQISKKTDKCDYNARSRRFRKELRAYHDSINATNRYSLSKIAGKLNVFESDTEEEDKERLKKEDANYEIDRRIPNTGLMVLVRNGMYALGDINGEPITDFKYQFVEGCLGEHDKIVRCITDDGDIEDFSVETETIVEDGMGGADASVAVDGMGTADIGCGGENGDKDHDYSEINYNKVEKALTIPYLCGARVMDMGRWDKRRRKKRKTKRKTRR